MARIELLHQAVFALLVCRQALRQPLLFTPLCLGVLAALHAVAHDLGKAAPRLNHGLRRLVHLAEFFVALQQLVLCIKNGKTLANRL